jgi:hypothetical protein
VVSFFNELEIRKLCSKLVSFFNELEIRKSCSRWFHFLMSLKLENHAQRPLFHFLTRLPQRHKNYPRNSLLDHGFQEDNAPEGHRVKGQNSDHGFQEIFTRWKEHTLEGTHVKGCDRGKEIMI